MTARHHNDPVPETLLQDVGDFCNSDTHAARVEEIRISAGATLDPEGYAAALSAGDDEEENTP